MPKSTSMGNLHAENSPEILLRQACRYLEGVSNDVPDPSNFSINELILGIKFLIETGHSEDSSAIEKEARTELLAAYEDAILDKERSVYGSAVVNAIWYLHVNPRSEDDTQYPLHYQIMDDASGTNPLDVSELAVLLYKVNYGPRLQVEEHERNELACLYAALTAIFNRTEDKQKQEKLQDEITGVKSAMVRHSIQKMNL